MNTYGESGSSKGDWRIIIEKGSLWLGLGSVIPVISFLYDILIGYGTYSVEELAFLLVEFILSISVHCSVLSNCLIQSIGENVRRLPL